MIYFNKITLAVLLMGAVPALGNCTARNIADDFGSVPLGSHVAKLPIGSKIESGCEKSGPTYTQCDFTSREGLTYSIYEGQIVAVSYEFKTPDSRQILGLRAGDGPDAIKALESRYGIKFNRSAVDSNTVFSTNFSKSKSCLVKCAVSITFDNKSHVKRIDKQPEDPTF